jgi:hydrogenase nickel incorporation protein HypB
MCATCGCSGDAVVRLIPADHDGAAHGHGTGHDHDDHPHAPGHGAGHDHDDHPPGHGAGHDHPHAPGHGAAGHDHDDHPHAPGHGAAGHDHDDHPHAPGQRAGDRTVILQQKVLAKNDELAQRNREWLAKRGVLAVNLMSSPGAGKTTLLERTARELAGKLSLSVIEGDQETALDGHRIRAAGAAVVQINTGVGCHLDAAMVAEGLRALDPPGGSVVVIENVGNLVCPALFDLGEQARVVIASVTEGADKPAKYPNMFRQADLVLVNKIDLLPYVEFDVRSHEADLRGISPGALVVQVSATTGQGTQAWYDWLRRRAPAPLD